MMSVVCLASGRANPVCRFNLKSSLKTLLASPSYSCHTFPRRRHRATLQQGVRLPVVSAAGESDYPAESPIVAVEGDLVTVHWDCIGEEGEILESSRSSEEPATFEIGAGDVVGNNLYQAFDEAVRGLAVGDSVKIKAQGGEWKKDLLFVVPRDHEEVGRLENRYKNQGGLMPNQVVQLSNGGMAVVVETDDEKVILDANSMLAGKTLTFHLEMLSIERGTFL